MEIDGIGSEQAQLAYLGAADGVAAHLAGVRVPAGGVAARLAGARVPARCGRARASGQGESTGGVARALRLAGAAGQQLAPRARSSASGVAWGLWTRMRRWRRPTSGGVAAASSVWWAEWRGRRGRGIGEERKEEDGTGIYRPHPFTPGAIPPPGVKVYLYSWLVTRTWSKGFFLAGHEIAAHLYSRVGFPPGSKGGLQFRFPPVLSNSLVKYNRNAIVFVKYIVN